MKYKVNLEIELPEGNQEKIIESVIRWHLKTLRINKIEIVGEPK